MPKRSLVNGPGSTAPALRITAALALLLLTVSGLFAQFGASGPPSHTTEKTRFAFIPIPNYSDVTGFGLGLMSSLFYPLNKNDKVSPASSTTLFGFYSSNQTWVVGAAQKLHLKEDSYRATLALATASVNFQFYDESMNQASILLSNWTNHDRRRWRTRVNRLIGELA